MRWCGRAGNRRRSPNCRSPCHPDSPRHAYVYAVALADAGRRPEAIRVLAESAKRRGDRDVLLALASFREQSGDQAGARQALQALADINPRDPALAAAPIQR